MPPRLNIPPITRVILIILLLQSVLSAAIRYRQWSAQSRIVIPYLNLIPQLSLIYPWTLLSTTLVESNIFTLGIACITLYQGGRYLERAWSSHEFAKFLLVASVLPNLLTFAVLVVLFSITQEEDWTLTVIAGTVPLQIAFLVAFSQLIPAHTVTLFRGLFSLRVPRFPLLYLTLIFVLSLTPLLTAASTFLAIFGFLSSWTYLRFYKSVFPDLDASQGPSLRGDASETFAIAEFFPGPVKPVLAAFANSVFDVLVLLRLCTPFTDADISARSAAAAGGDGSYLHHGHRVIPGSTRAEAERRRALALKALDQRLHAAAAATRGGPSTAVPVASPTQQPGQSTSTTANFDALPLATGPTVQTQPRPNTQSAMTTPTVSSGPVYGAMLGETNYVPEQDTSVNPGA